MNDDCMSVRVIHGANEGRFTLAGKTVRSIAKSLRDVFNIPDDAQAFVAGKLVDGDHIVANGDNVEFVRTFGRKGGLHDLWSEDELRQLWGGDTVNERIAAGMTFTHRPCLTSHEVVRWNDWKGDGSEECHRQTIIEVDIEDEYIVVNGKAYDIDQQLAAIVKCLVDANGERRSQRDIKEQFPTYVVNERIDNIIRRKLITHKSGVGRFIRSDTRGFRLAIPEKQRA